jgi:hypothetical protein
MGYSGIATYTKSPGATPIDAEEGISGRLGNKVTGKVDSNATDDVYGALYQEMDEKELQAMDSEGRVVITDHGLFVLFNVRMNVTRYCLSLQVKTDSPVFQNMQGLRSEFTL